MARRQRTSPFDDAVEIPGWLFRFIPPWVSIPVAIIGLIAIPALWLHPSSPKDTPSSAIAVGNHTAKPVDPTAGLGPARERVSATLKENFKPLITILGWSVGGMWAVVWLSAGFAGWQHRRKRAAFLQENIDLKWLWTLSWREFEGQVAELFRQQGCHVEEVGGGGMDGGVDLVVTHDGGKTFIQCKHWREGKVGVKPVRELYGVMAADGAQQGILITSGKFTNEALRFAEGKRLQLIDGSQCAQMFRQFQRSVAQAVGTPILAASELVAPDFGIPNRPKCPLCRSEMVLRRAKRGTNAGKEIWGCSQFPTTGCKGIVNPD